METKSDPLTPLLAEIERLMDVDPEPDSDDGVRLNQLVDEALAYEKPQRTMGIAIDLMDGLGLGLAIHVDPWGLELVIGPVIILIGKVEESDEEG
jgi:hypothetical protein